MSEVRVESGAAAKPPKSGRVTDSRWLRNREPKLWVCQCGQVNLAEERLCFTCAGERAEVEEVMS
jgi:hypothetical protein